MATDPPRTTPSPTRVQLRRTNGWRMPADTVKVCRPSVFGNPFTPAQAIEAGYAKPDIAQEFVVRCFQEWLDHKQTGSSMWWQGPGSRGRRQAILPALPSLRGKNLACWCRLGQPCHADVLLALANG
jgi:hypothetical protein